MPRNTWLAYLGGLFAVRLLILHLRKNHLLLLQWVAVAACAVGGSGRLLGIPYLFLDPEYAGQVSWASFLLVGLGLGVFSAAFHLSSFALDARQFRFLAGTSWPFTIFWLNNLPLPLALLAGYSWQIWQFQRLAVGLGWQARLGMLVALVVGWACIQILLLLLFGWLRRGSFLLAAYFFERGLRRSRRFRVRAMREIQYFTSRPNRVNHFLDLRGRLRPIGTVPMLTKEDAVAIFKDDQLLAMLLQFVLLAILILLGLVGAGQYAEVPAAASCLFLLSLLTIFIGLTGYWFDNWGLTAIVALALLANQLLTIGWLKAPYLVPGLKYFAEGQQPAPGPPPAIIGPEAVREAGLQADRRLTPQKGNQMDTAKPLAVLLCFSGGGQRAAIWALAGLAMADSATKGRLYDNALLMAGASGGMIGAAVYRQMRLEPHLFGARPDSAYKRMAMDLLNPVIFSYVSHDLPFRVRHYQLAGRRYPFDRGRAFDEQLARNLGGWIERPLLSYARDEQSGACPALLITPTIVQDGSKIYMCASPLTFLATRSRYGQQATWFANQYAAYGATDLTLATALRLNATFPYVLPNTTLPGPEGLKVMDAGLADNYGIGDAVRYLDVMEPWLKAHTRGVLLLSIRDHPFISIDPANHERQTLINQVFNPIGSLYTNWQRLQDEQNLLLISTIQKRYPIPIHYERIQYERGFERANPALATEEDQKRKAKSESYSQRRASLSWHLTPFEIGSIRAGLRTQDNLTTLDRLKDLFAQGSGPGLALPNTTGMDGQKGDKGSRSKYQPKGLPHTTKSASAPEPPHAQSDRHTTRAATP